MQSYHNLNDLHILVPIFESVLYNYIINKTYACKILRLISFRLKVEDEIHESKDCLKLLS